METMWVNYQKFKGTAFYFNVFPALFVYINTFDKRFVIEIAWLFWAFAIKF